MNLGGQNNLPIFKLYHIEISYYEKKNSCRKLENEHGL